jgi:hypothetical protein
MGPILGASLGAVALILLVATFLWKRRRTQHAPEGQRESFGLVRPYPSSERTGMPVAPRVDLGASARRALPKDRAMELSPVPPRKRFARKLSLLQDPTSRVNATSGVYISDDEAEVGSTSQLFSFSSDTASPSTAVTRNERRSRGQAPHPRPRLDDDLPPEYSTSIGVPPYGFQRR